MIADRNWIYDPETTAVGRLPAHSDHKWSRGGRTVINRNGGTAGPEGTPDCVSLNGEWFFEWARTPEEGNPAFYRMDRDLSGMKQITVPGCLELQGYGQIMYSNTTYPWDGLEECVPPQVPKEYNPVGRYIRIFRFPEEWNGRPVIIRFDGAGAAMFLWVNGEFAGYSEGSFTPAEFDISRLLHFGENRIAVETVKYCTGSWMEDQDFFRYSGLFRDVSVFALPDMHVEDVFVHTALDGNGGAVITADIRYSLRYPGGKLGYAVLDADGSTVANDILDCLEKKLVIRLEDPRLWSAEDPYLYELDLFLWNGRGMMPEIARVRFGIREVKIEDGILKVNGKRIVFRGVNRHEFSLTGGRTVSEEEMTADIRFLKQNNINAVRTCHYPDCSLWYELCDRYGIYLIDEANLESHGSWATASGEDPTYNVPASDPVWNAAVIDRAESMLERDKNHPSIIMWSLGNESYGGEVLRNMSHYFHRRDPERPVHYESICHCREFEDISDVESRMYLPPQGVREYLENDPEKPFMLCEYMHAMGNSLGGMKEYTDLEELSPQYAGGFIWDMIDQAALLRKPDGEPFIAYGGDFDDRPTAGNFCGDGILFADRTESPKVCEAKALYAPVRIDVNKTDVTVTNREFFTDTGKYGFTAELFENGYSVKRAEIDVPAVRPGCSVTVSHGMTVHPAFTGETVFRVTAYLKEGTEMVPEGHEVSFGEYVSGRFRSTGRDEAPGYQVIRGFDVCGVRTENTLVRFPLASENLFSVVHAGRELFTRTPKIVLWKALTDNDRGNRQQFRLAGAKAAEYGQIIDNVRCRESDGRLSVIYEYLLPANGAGNAADAGGIKVPVTYEPQEDGSILLTAELPAGSGLDEIPAFGVSFELKSRLSNISYYGLGPEENYPDRANGVRLCRFDTTPAGAVTPYLKPQECGNHTGVRELTLTDDSGHGIRFTAEGAPFSASVLPYSASELENAYHLHELPEPSGTHVRILAGIQGVGGIDSWGALPSDGYRLFPEEGMTLKIRLSFV